MDSILNEIYNIYSISSGEKIMSTYLKNAYTSYGYNVKEDNLYSIFFNKKSDCQKKLMIAFPLDESGLMISGKNSESFDFIMLEDISIFNYINQRIKIITQDYDEISGVIEINRKLMENSDTKIDLNNLYINIFETKEKVNIGDLVGLDSPLLIKDNLLIGRSLNQKIFQYISIIMAKMLRNESLPIDLYFGAVAQSTIGFRGTKTATYVIKPDIAIALTAFETKNSQPAIRIGDGVILGLYDKQMIPNQNFIKYINNNYNVKPYIGNMGNDGSFMHKTINGAATISIGIPMTNLGTSSVIVSKNDIDKLINFLYNFIKNFSYEEILL